jgi:hypothetical protein
MEAAFAAIEPMCYWRQESISFHMSSLLDPNPKVHHMHELLAGAVQMLHEHQL